MGVRSTRGGTLYRKYRNIDDDVLNATFRRPRSDIVFRMIYYLFITWMFSSTKNFVSSPRIYVFWKIAFCWYFMSQNVIKFYLNCLRILRILIGDQFWSWQKYCAMDRLNIEIRNDTANVWSMKYDNSPLDPYSFFEVPCRNFTLESCTLIKD